MVFLTEIPVAAEDRSTNTRQRAAITSSFIFIALSSAIKENRFCKPGFVSIVKIGFTRENLKQKQNVNVYIFLVFSPYFLILYRVIKGDINFQSKILRLYIKGDVKNWVTQTYVLTINKLIIRFDCLQIV